MTTTRQWLQDQDALPPELREAMRSAAEDEPGAAALTDLELRLSSVLGPPSGCGGGSGPTSGGSAPVLSLAAKKIVLLVTVVATTAGLALTMRPSHRAHRLPPRAPVESPNVEREPAPAERALVPPPAPTDHPLASPPPAPAAPNAPPASPRPRAAHSSPVAPVDRIAEEARLVREIRTLLGSDAAAALRLTDEHRARFPDGRLGQEREVLAIEALVRLGRRADAAERARRFYAAFPRSGHVPRLVDLTGAEPPIHP